MTCSKTELCPKHSDLKMLVGNDKRMFPVTSHLEMSLTVKVYLAFVCVERRLAISKVRLIKKCYPRTVGQPHRGTLSLSRDYDGLFCQLRLTFHVEKDCGCHEQGNEQHSSIFHYRRNIII